jgi:hypothetical protein
LLRSRTFTPGSPTKDARQPSKIHTSAAQHSLDWNTFRAEERAKMNQAQAAPVAKANMTAQEFADLRKDKAARRAAGG